MTPLAIAMNVAPADTLNADLADPGAHAVGAGSLAVVIPCHNEADSLVKLRDALERLRWALAGRCSIEVLLIDDGSTDQTVSLMHRYFDDQQDVTIVRH